MAELAGPDEIRGMDWRHVGRHLWIYNCVDSTNTRALALANDPRLDGLVLVAKEQTAGRGQYGRTWQATPASSVLMSVLLFPPPALRRPALLTTWAAVAVSEAVCRLTLRQPQIKWPNDVLLDGKKICGILSEQRNSGDGEHPLAAVAGIGLNVTQPAAAFTQAGLTLAGSLASQTGNSFFVEDVMEALIGELDHQYQALLRGDLATAELLWRERLGLLGQRVRVEGLQRDYHGRLLDVRFAGISVESEPGRVITMPPEEVRRIVAAD